jgi:hypothetical protein
MEHRAADEKSSRRRLPIKKPIKAIYTDASME